MEKIDIYTDASLKGDYITTGCFVIKEDESEYWSKTSKIEIEKAPYGIINATGAEFLAVVQTIRRLLKKRIQYDVIFYSDSLNLFQFFEIKKSKPRSKQNKKLVPLINKLLEEYRNIGGKIEFRWVPGHKGVYGNVKADNICSRLQRGLKIKYNIF